MLKPNSFQTVLDYALIKKNNACLKLLVELQLSSPPHLRKPLTRLLMQNSLPLYQSTLQGVASHIMANLVWEIEVTPSTVLGEPIFANTYSDYVHKSSMFSEPSVPWEKVLKTEFVQESKVTQHTIYNVWRVCSYVFQKISAITDTDMPETGTLASERTVKTYVIGLPGIAGSDFLKRLPSALHEPELYDTVGLKHTTEYKWHRYAKKWFYLQNSIYILFVAAFLFSVVNMVKYIDKIQTNGMSNYYLHTSWGQFCLVVWIVLLSLDAFFFTMEARQLWKFGAWRYFKQPWNYLDQ